MEDADNTSTPIYVEVEPLRVWVIHYVHNSAGKFVARSRLSFSKKYLRGLLVELEAAEEAAAQDELPFA